MEHVETNIEHPDTCGCACCRWDKLDDDVPEECPCGAFFYRCRGLLDQLCGACDAASVENLYGKRIGGVYVAYRYSRSLCDPCNAYTFDAGSDPRGCHICGTEFDPQYESEYN